MPTIWIDERIEVKAGQESLSFDSEQTMTISFFSFNSADNTNQCSGLSPSSRCDELEGCLLKLGPDETTHPQY